MARFRRVRRRRGSATPGEAAAGILALIGEQSRHIHRLIYAHPRGFAPEDILAAMGDARAPMESLLQSLTSVTLPVGRIEEKK